MAVVPEGSGLNSSARMLQINQHKYSKIINTFTYILTYFASNINIPLRPAYTRILSLMKSGSPEVKTVEAVE